MRAPTRLVIALAYASSIAACGDDGGDTKDTTDTSVSTDTGSDTVEDTVPDTGSDTGTVTTTDTGTDTSDVVVPPGPPFEFGVRLGQSMGEAPFPNDVALGADGFVDVAPLEDDTRYGALAKSELLVRTDVQMDRRRGFSFESSVYFPMNVEPDLATFADAVHFVALDGPEVGKVMPAEVFWSAPGRLLGAFPKWGSYLVPGSRYAVIVDTGVKDSDGNVIAANADFAAVVATEPPSVVSPAITRARTIYAPLSAYLGTRDTSAIIGTVFTTEDAYSYLDALMTATHAFTRVAPTKRVRSTSATTLTWQDAVDVAGPSALSDYFGVASGAFQFQPGGWGPGNRDAAKAFTTDSQPYTGGTFAQSIGYVINGSILAPSFNLRANETTGAVTSGPITFDGSGKPTPSGTVMVPFTLYLCHSHLDGGGVPKTSPLPIAIFTHGGTALRSDALAFANVNCIQSRATISMDLPFHGGRQAVKYFADAGAIVPVQPDVVNTYKDVSAGGRSDDYIGDNGDATATVGGLFALDKNLDPEIIEANHLAVAVEAETLVGYLKDTSATGLGAALGLTFDTSTLVHESLSFGTSFGTAFLAHTTDLSGAIISVGSGQMLSANLPMAPNNANLASNLFVSVLGLKTDVGDMVRGAYRDPIVALFQWLAQRGDPLAYAPFVMRHRKNDKPFPVVGFGDSWDETLFTPAQITFANAWGLPVFTTAGYDIDPAIPGADAVESTPYPSATPPSNNLTVGAKQVSAGYFYLADACHAEVVVPLCESNYQPPYPPPTARAEAHVFRSPICAQHAVMREFLQDVTAGDTVEIGAPSETTANDCPNIYD